MASTASFDVSTGADLQEGDNAVNQAQKEIIQRYDFKGSKASLSFDRAKATLTLVADDDFKMKALFDVLQSKIDRKSTRLNSSHLGISYAVFCLKKKTANQIVQWNHGMRQVSHRPI